MGIANFAQGSAVITRTSEDLVCSVNSSLVGMCTKATGYSVTGALDGDTLVVRLLIANVSCNDSGEYTCSLQQNPEAKAVTTLNIERLPEEPRLTMSREIIHNKFTLGDRPFICEGQLGVPAGNLFIESDFQDEFKPFLDINNRNNSIGFIFKEETIANACGTYQKLYFAFHKADFTMNLRKFRCSIKPSESLANQNVKLSGVGTIKVVPDTWCQNVTSESIIEHPYLCHVGVSCDAKGAILGVPLGCKETQCFNVFAHTACPECTCNKQGPVTTTTTTVSPDAEQMYCTPQSVGNVRGERVNVYCTLLNVNVILQLNVSKDGRTIRSEINASGLVQVAFPEMSLMISETSINITLIMTNCSVEDSYTISINNGTTGTFTTWLTENATSPSMSVAPKKWLNQPFSINCTGNVGRISGGAYRSKLYIQWGSQFQKDKLYGGVSPPICNDACQCTETIEIAITANGTWNNTEVRCIAVDNNDTIVSASGSETVVLSESVVSFTSNTTAIVDKEKIVECRLKGIFNSAQDIAIITRSSGDLVCEFNGELQGNCSTLTGYSVSGYRDGDTLLMRLIIANMSCNDSGEYVCSSKSNTGAQAKTTLSVQRLPEIPQLTMSREIIHNKFTRADLPFICEGELGVPPGKLSIEIDIQNEFETFLDLNNKTNSIASIFKEETIPASCGMYQKFYFGFQKADVSMNLRKFRCSIKPSLELPNGDVKYSEEGVIKVVPDTWCENRNETNIEHPYLCHVGVVCNADGGIAGVPELCNKTQCRNFTTYLCTECVCDKKGPTIVTTTTISPDAQQVYCNSTSIASYIGEQVSVSCMLINVDTVNQLNVSKDGGSLYSQSNPRTSVVVNPGLSLIISTTNINVTLSLTNCTIEGLYTISINNGTSAMFQVWLIEEPKVPILTKPTTVWLNQPFEITCVGNVGRTTGGNARSSLYIEVKKVGDALVTHIGQPSNCSELCSCAGSATIKQTADQSWNNSEVRCVAKNASGVILSSSAFTMIQLSNTVVNFISNNSAQIGEAKVIECVTQGDDLNGGEKITRKMDGLVCTINSQATGNCSNSLGYFSYQYR
ncbi:uncharacterized protein LOC127836255 [Dreissena polymorpha]|uniref:uncharacterized protein LOC127836255 n=1 Tax=Dreissena polymorpha TaxID=45954 RepID=UPI002265070F|nr:uncharacterized protein LOC127836255 [Dreissena polymorpha]